MLKRLRLDQTKKYEQSIASYEIAKMLVDFVKGRQHYLCIGAEQGDIPQWDDFIIQDKVDSYIHIQVKRYTNDFSNDLIIRDTYKQGNRKGTLRGLSPFDKTLESLAEWTKNNDPATVNPKRKFWIELPEGNIKIKNGFNIKDFKSLCETQIKSVTTADRLELLAENNSTVKNCYDWLTKWCDFKDWEHILKSLRILEIKTIDLESVIKKRTEDLLKDIFCTDKVSDIRLKIVSYIDENSTYTGTIKPRQLLFELQNYLLPNIALWTQFEKVGTHWNISGIHDLEFNDKIERPSIIVPSLWNNDKIRELKISAAVNENCKLSESLMRLAIHQKGKVNTYCKNEGDWKSFVKNKVGGTIGTDQEDLNDLNISENTEVFSTSDNKTLKSRSEHESISKDLHTEMLAQTWTLVVMNIEKKIDEMKSTELRNAVEIRWNIWKPQFEGSADEQNELFLSMLHPNAEGEDICGELRVGAKTSNLLADGLFLLLIVSVCLDVENKGDWKKITSNFSVNTIGLCFWSGPIGKRRKVREITDNGIEELIGKETADILIISKTNATAGDICNNDLTGNDYSESLASSNYPKLLVTNHIKLKRMIEKGEIIPLTKYLNSFIEKSNNSKQVAIQKAIS